MTDNNQDQEQAINSKIAYRKLTTKQLELQMKRLEQQQAKAKDKLAKQIERKKVQELKAQARKHRNKKIYDWGGLIPMVFGVENFDQVADNQGLKNVLIGLLVKIKQEIETNGRGLTENGKPTWLEAYRKQGEQFIKTHSSNKSRGQ